MPENLICGAGFLGAVLKFGLATFICGLLGGKLGAFKLTCGLLGGALNCGLAKLTCGLLGGTLTTGLVTFICGLFGGMPAKFICGFLGGTFAKFICGLFGGIPNPIPGFRGGVLGLIAEFMLLLLNPLMAASLAAAARPPHPHGLLLDIGLADGVYGLFNSIFFNLPYSGS